jgi:hypothetical protein
MLAAEQKAGKTWAELDLVVATAAGKAWMGVYPIHRQGRVVVFLGEGGKRKMLRRLRAVCAFHGVRLEDLPITLCFRAPRLSSELHMAAIAEELAAHDEVALIVVDPLYLAAQGAKASALYEMGAHLERIQLLAQDVGAALMVVHHWNQTGAGRGVERMSGAGPAEWGRVLVSVAVKAKSTDPATRATKVTLDWEFVGDEIPDTHLRIRRRVWAADPDDLNSPLNYEVEELIGGDDSSGTLGGEKPAVRRVHTVLAATDRTLSVSEIGDALAADSTGMPLKARTIQDALSRLRDLGMAAPDRVDGAGPGRPGFGWRAVGISACANPVPDRPEWDENEF